MFDTTYGVYRSASQINEAMGRVYGYMGLAVVISIDRKSTRLNSSHT